MSGASVTDVGECKVRRVQAFELFAKSQSTCAAFSAVQCLGELRALCSEAVPRLKNRDRQWIGTARVLGPSHRGDRGEGWGKIGWVDDDVDDPEDSSSGFKFILLGIVYVSMLCSLLLLAPRFSLSTLMLKLDDVECE